MLRASLVALALLAGAPAFAGDELAIDPFSPGRLPRRLSIRDRLAQINGKTAAPFNDALSAAGEIVSREQVSRGVMLVACAGTGMIGLLLMLFHRRRTAPAALPVAEIARPATPAVPAFDPLKPLIANTLPIVEEELLLPAAARLFGRPVMNLRYRLDAEEPAREPHFTEIPQMTPISENFPSETGMVNWISAAEQGVGEPSYLRFGPGATERTPIVVEGEYR
jgi:hypothetical protein